MQTFFSKFKNFRENRFDTLVLIIYNYFLVFLISNKDMDWTFHPFKNDFIADNIGLQFDNPKILPKFGLVFRFLTIVCNLFGFLPVCIPKRKYREFLMPVLIWNVYTVTALLINLCHTFISIISLQIPWKAVFSVGIAGGFVTALFLKLIIQLVNFYDHLQFVH
ncbi:uncharacterized protein LOC129921003 [Episyrphus balteatus]|uniref:uncharacterized protein LOC129921003 n=1 Tax=Episyrphus balteatus TaxID=286459 RepID=UPI0024864DAB|nr:uncharacterized protein LOC129921003 [Episyrphus balteatus]